MLEERLNYLSILSTENSIAKSLPKVKERAAKKYTEITVEVCRAAN